MTRAMAVMKAHENQEQMPTQHNSTDINEVSHHG